MDSSLQILIFEFHKTNPFVLLQYFQFCEDKDHVSSKKRFKVTSKNGKYFMNVHLRS